MIKKLILASLVAVVLNSCDRNENIENGTQVYKGTEESEKQNKQTVMPSFSVYLNSDPTNKCAGSEQSISLNGNYTYHDDYNVNAIDGQTGNCPANGKACIDLSHFLYLKGAHMLNNYLPGPSTERIGVYYGDSEQILFNNYNPTQFGTMYEKTFTIASLTNGYFFTGGVNDYMPNDAANTALQFFKTEVGNLPNNGQGVAPKIKAVHFMTEAYLCIPAKREVRMSVKYSY